MKYEGHIIIVWNIMDVKNFMGYKIVRDMRYMINITDMLYRGTCYFIHIFYIYNKI